jgi:uncharacterized protein (TIGR02246 family)
MVDSKQNDPLSNREQIRDVLARYCHACDDGGFDELGQLFTEDGALEVKGQIVVGRHEIASYLARALPPERRGKHVTSSMLITLDPAGGEATALTDYVIIGRAGEGFDVRTAGRYHDQLVREPDGRWRFARREVVTMGDSPRVLDEPAQRLPG